MHVDSGEPRVSQGGRPLAFNATGQPLLPTSGCSTGGAGACGS
jgi:hypothetical protein